MNERLIFDLLTQPVLIEQKQLIDRTDLKSEFKLKKEFADIGRLGSDALTALKSSNYVKNTPSKSDMDRFSVLDDCTTIGNSFRPLNELKFLSKEDIKTVNSFSNQKEDFTSISNTQVSPDTVTKKNANDFQLKGKTNLKRNWKHKFTRDFKQLIINEVEAHGMPYVCQKYSVSRKNVDRWRKNGPDRKKGAGRKTIDPGMEQDILAWVEDFIRKEQRMPKRKYIIVKGTNFASNNFKASKGWCDKFLRRNKDRLDALLNSAVAVNKLN